MVHETTPSRLERDRQAAHRAYARAVAGQRRYQVPRGGLFHPKGASAA